MDNPFEALETTLNAVTLSALTNASLIWDAYRADGVFDAAHADSLGMANSRPVFRCQAVALPDIAPSVTVSLRYGSGVTDYTVQAIEPDGTGLILLILRRV